eukprot:CAMPEP_0113688268 /NCGR_PEP_ID=MMETSP0038_2-20120614/16424_1 /TAXON_ID=2898 /ORGANISM="Cryptomonas paramecium" /LENGTH=48 /DNA_ID=CAMNT_0000609029 /DNA_START=33 /DNA_END=179 /DNA_ORIENTATION=- /assembly_acc=CAM_ASM_000170
MAAKLLQLLSRRPVPHDERLVVRGGDEHLAPPTRLGVGIALLHPGNPP